MNGSVQELIDKTEKLVVNPEIPEYSTNWCNLPVEMQFECIKWMDFETRTRLGATSHTEKSLVEAKKYHFDIVTLAYNRYACFQSSNVLLIGAMMKYSSFGNFHLETIKNHEKTLNCLVKILKNCQIDTFQFCEPDGPSDLLVINAKLVQFNNLRVADRGVYQLVQKWIDNHSEIWKTLRFVTHSAEFVESFASKFKDRVICKTDDEVRIRTNEESKHILIRCNLKGRSMIYYSCTIIPSNLLKYECEKMLNQLRMKRL